MPRGWRALACVKLIPQEDAAKFTDLYWDKVDWEIGSLRLAGIEGAARTSAADRRLRKLLTPLTAGDGAEKLSTIRWNNRYPVGMNR
jgi:hypothetical protein